MMTGNLPCNDDGAEVQCSGYKICSRIVCCSACSAGLGPDLMEKTDEKAIWTSSTTNG